MASVIVLRERRVCHQQPAARRDAVGLVAEAFGKHFSEIFDRRCAQQPRVNRRDTVGAVRADDRQVGHANLALGAFLDEAHALDASLVAGKTMPNLIEQTAIDLEDDLQMTRQHDLEPCERPFFESFGQQRVIGVRQSLLRKVPGFVPSEVRFVEQNPHQLRYRHRRMRIVELNRDFLGKRAPIGVARAGSAARDRPASKRPENTPAQNAIPAPWLVESSGYKTRVSDSASSVSASAPTKSPLLNS